MSDSPANWYADPTGRHELRYFDGARWTNHVSDKGITGTDPLDGPPTPAPGAFDKVDSVLTLGNEGKPETLHKQLTDTGHKGVGLSAPVPGGGGTLLTEPVLIVNQKAKLIELNNQYSVFDQAGNQIAAVNQVGQSALKKAARLVSSLDQFMTHQLQITDANGQVVLKLTRPRKIMKSSVIVENGAGQEIGRIVQQNMIGKIRFALESGGQQVGEIRAENWRAWNFSIVDHTGNEVARVTKTFEGIAKTLFTTADNYVLQIHQRPSEPLNSLVVASALSIDTALKQDSRGFS